jgi:hypothetical protein
MQNVTDDQIKTYQDQGYLAFEDMFTPTEVEEAKAALHAIVDTYAFNEERGEYAPPATTKRTRPVPSSAPRIKAASFSRPNQDTSPTPRARMRSMGISANS